MTDLLTVKEASPAKFLNKEAKQENLDIQEIDLIPKEDDTNEMLVHKLQLAKNARTHAESDRRLLVNRINLLKQEERNAHKKIIDTEQKTVDIINAYNRNSLRTADRVARKQSIHKQIVQKNQVTRVYKGEIESGIKRAKLEDTVRKGSAATQTRQDLRSKMGIREFNKQQELKKAQGNRYYIRNAQSAAKEHQTQLFHERKDRGVNMIEEKLNFEATVKANHDIHLTQMEQEEQELLMRLKNTQAVVQQAHQEFEQALIVENPNPKAFEEQNRAEINRFKKKRYTTTSVTYPREVIREPVPLVTGSGLYFRSNRKSSVQISRK